MTRRWPRIMIAAVWFVLAPTPALAVLDGNQWRGLPDSGREAYVTGVVDTWSEVWGGIKMKTVANPAYAPGAVEHVLRSVSECAQPMTYGRIIAIVEKYMKDHPEIWHYRMASNVFAAIQGSCPQ
jgi:hypothetical protein